jgi:hypothetical protein
MMIAQFFVVLFFFPETKQISLEDLQRKLQISLGTAPKWLCCSRPW